MGHRLSAAAWAVCGDAAPIGKKRNEAPPGSLGPFERLVLLFLAEKANDVTGIAWPGQATIKASAGCSMNTVAPSLQRLAELGHISIMPGRQGTFPVYAVHPGGLTAEPFTTPELAQEHLAAGRFGKEAKAAVIAWLATLGMVAGPAAVAAMLGNLANTLATKHRAPPTVGGAGWGRNAAQPLHTPNGCAIHPQPLTGAPPANGDEPIIEPEKEPIARKPQTDPSEMPCPADGEQGAYRAGATGITAPGKASAADNFDWRGDDLREVLARRMAVGDTVAARLANMSDADALDAITIAQRQAGKHLHSMPAA